MAEIADSALAELQAAYKLLDAVMKNPKTKAKAHAILKELNPNASIPEYDIQQTVSSETAALRKELADLRTELKSEKELSDYTQQFDKAASKFGVTSEGKDKVLKLMHERGIRDPEAGMLLFNDMNPAPAPVTTSGWENQRMYDPSPETELGAWFKDPEGKRDSEIRAALADVRR